MLSLYLLLFHWYHFSCVAGNDVVDSPSSIVMAGIVSPVAVSPTPVASPSQLYKSHSDYNMQRVSGKPSLTYSSIQWTCMNLTAVYVALLTVW